MRGDTKCYSMWREGGRPTAVTQVACSERDGFREKEKVSHVETVHVLSYYSKMVFPIYYHIYIP